MPQPISTAIGNARASLKTIDIRIQVAFAVLVAVPTIIAAYTAIVGVRQSLDMLCGKESLSQCFSRVAGSSEKQKSVDEFFRNTALARQAALEKRQRQFNDMQTRTRLAEGEWGKPYQGPVIVGFVDHSVIKAPVCPFGEEPAFGLFPALPAGMKIEYSLFDGYWLFDVSRETGLGKVYARGPLTAEINLSCQPQTTPKPAN